MRFPTPAVAALAVPALLAAFSTPVSAATLVASYDFNDTLAAQQVAAPALASIDPFGLNGFESAAVNGQTRPVFAWYGSGQDPTRNAGFSLDATGLVAYDHYSVALTFEFTEGARFGGGWRRILDTQNRQSDSGFYVNPADRLEAVEIPLQTPGNTRFATPGFHQVVLAVTPDGAHQRLEAYLDGQLELSASTDLFRLDNANNPGHLLHFFVDNTGGGAQQEYANGRIASLRLYDGTLVPSAIPEPATGATMALGAMLLAGWARCRSRCAR